VPLLSADDLLDVLQTLPQPLDLGYRGSLLAGQAFGNFNDETGQMFAAIVGAQEAGEIVTVSLEQFGGLSQRGDLGLF
jgi:hypothetical protein